MNEKAPKGEYKTLNRDKKAKKLPVDTYSTIPTFNLRGPYHERLTKEKNWMTPRLAMYG